jgi:cell division septation protein DedD
LRILKEVSVDADSMVVAVHLLAGEAEIAICYGKVPVLLRTIRYSSEDADRVAEQIDTEAKRCLTLLPSTVTDQPVSWCIFVNSEFARSVGEAVEQQDQVYVQWVDPYYGWNVTGNPIELSAKSAANAGAALDILSQSLPVNLLAPKRPPKPPNPWVRWGAIGVLGVASASVAGYFLLTDIWDLQSEAKSLDSNLRNEAKVTSKYQEKADQVTTVEAWLSDQVDWVAELSDLASRLPDGQEATVRRLSGSVNAKGSGSIDLAMQVRSQEIISDLENRIRGAKYTIISKQITQNPDSQEYPWQFESHIEFPLTAPGLRRFEAIEATEKAKPDKPAASTEKSAEPVEPQATSETPVPTPPTIQPPTTQPPDIPPTESPTEPTNQSNNQSNNQSTVVPAEVKS